ncbi:hypothetical protein GGTG_05441 [Gaeumannomyces tritici R3-111a-1]|uniref:Uncharacterized protein n=1 Tax=Gaeumannomyces tritici (strain R3-111a-1) TaxID=644352 RepID=J3NVX9_GAET3|nr:hypothetical protein GGTG_05441 [Gaeumannomyces tritici R3-111a-1]EJT75508.1 hypothetical protein GGTG_05441 [Gaeumannomyces tritici R3-111a-1]
MVNDFGGRRHPANFLNLQSKKGGEVWSKCGRPLGGRGTFIIQYQRCTARGD